jgi:predicted metalloprotease
MGRADSAGLLVAAAAMGIQMDEVLELGPDDDQVRQRKEQRRSNYRKSIAEHLSEAKTQGFSVATKTAETWKKICAEKTKEFTDGKATAE